jgi:hypothetical protein
VGRLAGVVIVGPEPRATHLLVGCRPTGLDYRAVPIRWMRRADGESVWLDRVEEELTHLPTWADFDRQPTPTRAIGLPARLDESEAIP